MEKEIIKENTKKKLNDNKRFKSNPRLIMFFLNGSKRFFIASIICSLLVTTFELINPRIIAYTVDTVIGEENKALPGFLQSIVDGIGGGEYIKSHLYIIALVIIGVAALAVISRFMFRMFNARGQEKLVRNMRDTLYRHIIRLPVKWHNENQTGDIIQRCTSDVDTVRRFLAEQLTNLVRVVILIVMSIIFMLNINVKLAMIAIALVPVIILYSLFFHRSIGKSFQKVDDMEGRLSAMVQENLTGVRVVRAFGKESYERERFGKANSKYCNMWVRLMQLLSIFWATGDLVSGSQVMLVVAFGAAFCVRGTLTTGELIAFISYNALLTWPVRSLGRVISEMSKAGISIDRIRYIMNSVEEDNATDPREADMKGDITFENVTFVYPEKEEKEETPEEKDKKKTSEDIIKAAKEASEKKDAEEIPENKELIKVLDDVSFEIKAGTTIGILGGTGSGKSTLIQLLDRLLEIDEESGCSGRITIGGVDIRDIDRKYLRTNIGIVLQEPYLFSGTLAENISITDDSLDMDKVKSASKVAALEETVEKFSKGYETYVGERGVTLSGGQKQRTAIAQMLLRQPPIMVFDDSLSAVDAETDAKIRTALRERSKGTTTILIAHRISTIMHADMIIVLDRGRVVERGTHDELVAKGGLYNKIFRLQQPA